MGQFQLGPYLALPVLAAQATARPLFPASSVSSSSLNVPNNRRNQLGSNVLVDGRIGKEFNIRGTPGGGRKQYAGLPNRIDEGSDKNKLKKYDGASTVSVTDNEEIQDGSLSDNMLEEFYRTPMSFGTDNLTMVTTQVGATAFLPCRVHYIGDGVVSSKSPPGLGSLRGNIIIVHGGWSSSLTVALIIL